MVHKAIEVKSQLEGFLGREHAIVWGWKGAKMSGACGRKQGVGETPSWGTGTLVGRKFGKQNAGKGP